MKFECRYQFSKNKTTFWSDLNQPTRPSTSNQRNSHGNHSKGNRNFNSNDTSTNRQQTREKNSNKSKKFKSNAKRMEVD